MTHSANFLKIFLSALVAIVFLCPSWTSACQDDLELLEEKAVSAAVEKVSPSVVQIETIGGLDRVGEAAANLGPTTGLVVDEAGYILSSAFNFVQKPASIFVRGSNGKRVACEIVAKDHSRQLVLLKVVRPEKKNSDQESGFVVPSFKSRDQLKVGGWAIAIGKTYDPDSANISTGIVSALNRIWGKAIQTDAKISPNNFGGPLIDLEGNVIGILTPMSPSKESEMAGAEWYDSGIGFAVPVDELLPRISSMKKGEDQFPGKMGVQFEGQNVYADPAKIAALVGTSPAALAGMRAGDVIIEFEGKKISRQSELKHALGPCYSGDSVQVKVSRDDQVIDFEVKLAKVIDPFVQSFIGVVPELVAVSDGKPSDNGVTVASVMSGSSAETTGIKVNDTISAIDDQPISSRAEAQRLLMGRKLGDEVTLTVEREGQTLKIPLKLGETSAAIPNSVPLPKSVGEDESNGLIEVKIPEVKNLCYAYVPQKKFESLPGLFVMLPQPGAISSDDEQASIKKFIDGWKEVCDQSNLILLVPCSAEKSRWQPDEAEFIQKTVDQLRLSRSFDIDRVAIGGRGTSGSMAAIAALTYRDLFRGLFLENATIPGSVGQISADPVSRLLVIVRSTDEESKQKSDAVVKRFESAKIPVARFDDQTPTPVVDAISRWVLTLGRL